jgi:hypothetical protein
MGWGVGWGLMVGPSWVSILALLLLTGLSMFERWRFFAGGFLADVDSRDQERP